MQNLSQAAEALLQFHQQGGSLQVGARNPEPLPGLTVEQTQDADRELAAADLMIPLHTFAYGRDSRYRLTEAGLNHGSTRRASLEESLASSLIGSSGSGARLNASS